jgi:hypothetical protein
MPEPTSLSDWIDEVKKSTEYKAISLAFEAASFLSKAYDALKKVFFPDPSTAELIQQAVQQIIRAFYDAQAQDLAADMDGFARTYARYIGLKDPDLLDDLISGLERCLAKMERRIEGPDARSAALVAVAYNLGVPLLATATLQDAQVGQLYRPEKPNWASVLQENRSLFERAAAHNQMLLGPPVFSGEPRLPLWRYSQGKLAANAADRSVIETVWRANEYLREFLLADYPIGWFTVRSAFGAAHLVGEAETGAVRGVTDRPPDRSALWRLDHVSHCSVRVVNASSLCLTDCETGNTDVDPESRVRLLPSDAGAGEYDYQVFVVGQGGSVTHHVRRWHDGAWRRVGPAAVGVVGSAPAVFLNRAPASLFNVELFAWVDDQVRHYWRGARDQAWRLGDRLGFQVRSAPAAFQNRAAPSEFNYEVFVVEEGTLAHYWRSWNDGTWRRAARIGRNVTLGAAAFQNSLGHWDFRFNYEVFVVEDGAVQHYSRIWKGGTWRKGGRFGTDVRSAPAAFQNRCNGNYEVFVVENGRVQHYWCSPHEGTWRKGATFGTNVRFPPAVFQNHAPAALHNYEVFVIEGTQLQHYWRDWQDGQWRAGARFGDTAYLGLAAVQTLGFGDYQVWYWLDVTAEHRTTASIAFESKASTGRGRVMLRAGDVWTHRRTRIGEMWSDAEALVLASSDLAPAVERGSLEPLTAPGRFVRHQDFRAKVTPVASELDRKDATFRLMPGLASGTAISFEAVNVPGYFLRHRNFEVVLAARGSDATLRADATFRRRRGLADLSLVSFESENYPGHFLRHRSGLLYLERGEDAAFARDATFRLQPPRWAAP